MSVAQVQNDPSRTQYVDFWNEVLVPKFVRWKHILVDGLTLRCEAIFPTLPVKAGDKVVDAGCGFGDTAIKLARLVGPWARCSRSIARRISRLWPPGGQAPGHRQCAFRGRRCAAISFRADPRLLLFPVRHTILRGPGSRLAKHAREPQARRRDDHDRLARHQGKSLARIGQGGRAAVSVLPRRERADLRAPDRSPWPIPVW